MKNRELAVGPSALRDYAIFSGAGVICCALLVVPMAYVLIRVAPDTATTDEIATFLVVWGTVYLVANRLLSVSVETADFESMLTEMLAELRRKSIPRLAVLFLLLVAGIMVQLGLSLVLSIPIYRWLEIPWAAQKAWSIAGFVAMTVLAVAMLSVVAALFLPRGPLRRVVARLALRGDALGVVFCSLRSHGNRPRLPSARV